jgi:hypothetical protein
LTFTVRLVLPSVEGFDGIVVAGPKVDDGVARVGDSVELPTTSGAATGSCTGFPLINLGKDRVDWVRIAVRGVSSDEVVVGGTARC